MTRWSVGSILFLTSWSVLMGPRQYIQHLVSGNRLPFTAAYFGSIALTIYFAVGVSKIPAVPGLVSTRLPPYRGCTESCLYQTLNIRCGMGVVKSNPFHFSLLPHDHCGTLIIIDLQYPIKSSAPLPWTSSGGAAAASSRLVSHKLH